MNFVKSLGLLNRYLILLSVVFILITSIFAFIYASVQTVELCWELVSHHWIIDKVEVHFIEVIERFLTAIALLILGIGLYELFIHPLNVAEPLKVNNFHELKSNLGNVILLNMVVIFFGNLAENELPTTLVLQAIAIGIVASILIAFAYFNPHNHPHPKDPSNTHT